MQTHNKPYQDNFNSSLDYLVLLALYMEPIFGDLHLLVVTKVILTDKNFPSIQLQVMVHVKHIFTVCLHHVNYFIINKPGNFKLYETLTLLITYKCRMKTYKIVFFSKIYRLLQTVTC